MSVNGRTLAMSDWRTKSVRDLFFYFLFRQEAVTKEQLGEVLDASAGVSSELGWTLADELLLVAEELRAHVAALLTLCGTGTLALEMARHAGQLKNVLRNQELVAGIGNAYADEILHRSGVHPERPSHTLDRAAIDRIHRAIGAVLAEAIAAELEGRFPEFAGQAFGQLKDLDLELACVRAYNDWLIDEWVVASDRFIPQCIVPLWPVENAADEIRRGRLHFRVSLD